MLTAFRCDFHVHTCLSPCAELDMYPRAIVEKALAAKLDVIAICDHNASENAEYVAKAARGAALTVIPGMEITSSEEVHLLALFDGIEELKRMQAVIYDHLPGTNREQLFGCQAIVNDGDIVEGINDRFLLGATSLALQDIVQAVHRFGGLAIAAHVDRESFSILGQLGFIDPDLPLDAIEITHELGTQKARQRFPELFRYPFLESSDAHLVKDIGSGSTTMMLERANLQEIKMAFERRDGRYIEERVKHA